ncbi:MAG: glycoside hydrolase family 2 protein [Saprospiraceae bacterium]|nr:glycoside hydrolase family 2 protein [Saprospiraceae bacterium]
MLEYQLKKAIFLLMLIPIGLLAQQSEAHFSLKDSWHFQPSVALIPKDANDMGQTLSSEGYTTRLPNTVINALLENGVIDDPFYRTNEARLQWLEKKDWIFEKRFDASTEMLSAKHSELILRGLDTYAEVYLNDALLFNADNMFRTWKSDVQSYLKPKGNVLKIYFTSPLTKEKIAAANSYTDLPDGTRMFSRKAQFHYGWDWGPRIVTCGLQDAEIYSWSNVKISDVYFKQINVSAQKAQFQAQLGVETDAEKKLTVKIDFGEYRFTQEVFLSAGSNVVYMDLNIPYPKLWWTHNLGTPHLYNVTTSIISNESESITGILDQKTMKYGIRKIELVQEKDAKGASFFFRLNGEPIFAKGANIIPLHFFQEKVTSEMTEQVLESAKNSNMNMLRVWGGGIYQTDEFYNKCDEKGILIWQDFMYACAMYPGEDEFINNAKAEAIEQVQRLRHHSCIALWCGNNEINEAWNNWGWQPRFNPDQKTYIWKAYQDVFQKMLPEVVAQYGDGIAYYESSPRFGRYNPKSYTEGDNHDWFVWHDEKPFEHFEENIPRFMSEYGFQSFPDWRTIGTFTVDGDRELESKVMLAHQKHPKGNQLIKKYMDRSFQKTRNFEDFTYVSQLVQADGIRRAIEAQRRAKPYCMGSLYWQLNDVWQVASWSSIDNFGRWKALQYAARDAYADILISPKMQGDTLTVSFVNDKREAVEGDFFIYVMDFAGKVLYMDGRYKSLEANSSTIGYSNKLVTLLQGSSPNETLIVVSFKPKSNPEQTIQRTFFLVPPKNLNLERDVKVIKEVKPVEGGYRIRLRASSLLKSAVLTVNADGWFDQNYMDIIPNQDYTIFLKTGAGLFDVVNTLKIKSLVDTY